MSLFSLNSLSKVVEDNEDTAIETSQEGVQPQIDNTVEYGEGLKNENIQSSNEHNVTSNVDSHLTVPSIEAWQQFGFKVTNGVETKAGGCGSDGCPEKIHIHLKESEGQRYIQIHITKLFIQAKDVDKIVLFLDSCSESDTVEFMLASYEISMMYFYVLAGAIQRCKGRVIINLVYTFTFKWLALALLANELRVTDVSFVLIDGLMCFGWGNQVDTDDLVSQFKYANNRVYNLVVKSGIMSKEDIDNIIENQSSVLIAGDDLVKRVEQWNKNNNNKQLTNGEETMYFGSLKSKLPEDEKDNDTSSSEESSTSSSEEEETPSTEPKDKNVKTPADVTPKTVDEEDTSSSEEEDPEKEEEEDKKKKSKSAKAEEGKSEEESSSEEEEDPKEDKKKKKAKSVKAEEESSEEDPDESSSEEEDPEEDKKKKTKSAKAEESSEEEEESSEEENEEEDKKKKSKASTPAAKAEGDEESESEEEEEESSEEEDPEKDKK